MYAALDEFLKNKVLRVSHSGVGLVYEMNEEDIMESIKESVFALFANGKLSDGSPDLKMFAPRGSDLTLFDLHFSLKGDATNTPLILRYHHGANRFSYHIPKDASQHDTLADLVDAMKDVMSALVVHHTVVAPASDNPVDSHVV